jgi:MFS family permease
MPAPIALILVTLIAIFVKGDWRKEQQVPFDWQGAVIFGTGTTVFVIALTELPQWNHVLMLLASLMLMSLFIWHQSTIDQPLIRWQMFTQSRLYSCSLAAAFFMYASLYPLVFLLSLYLQYIHQLSPSDTGKIILMQGVAMAILAPLSGRLSDSIQPRKIATLGCLVVASGFLMLAQLDMTTTPFYIGSSFFLIGIGMGLFTSPNNNAVLSAVNNKDLGVATATMNLARVMGNVIGMSVVNLLINTHLGDKQIIPQHYSALETTISAAIMISLVYVVVGTVMSALRGKEKYQ